MRQRERLDEYETLCREYGLAMTAQRRVILGELVSRRDHPTADQIYDAVRDRLPGLSRTTVYRVLETFVRVGVARKVSHPDAVARFDPLRERHHHLLCVRCGEIFDVNESKVTRVPLPRTTGGFLIRDYSINFTGICAVCRHSQGGKAKS